MPSRWTRHWFGHTAADDVALHRIACYCVFLSVYGFNDFSGWASVSPNFWMPISFFHLLPGPPRSILALVVIQIVWKFSLLSSAAGFLTRRSTVLAAALGFFLLGLPNCFGKIHHLDGFPVLLMVIFAISPCGDALSIDSWIARRRPRSLPEGNDVTESEYAWPVKLGQIMFLLIFGAAGISKLWHSGAAWLIGSNIRYLLIGNAFLHPAPSHLATLIASSPALSQLAGIFTVTTELAALPAIFIPRLRAPVVCTLLLLQTGIALAMGIYFLPHLAGYTLFVPWNRLLRKFSTSSPQNRPAPQLRI